MTSSDTDADAGGWEMASCCSGDEDEMTLEELVTTNPLPQVAKVTVGWTDPNDPENSFSTGDVIEVCLPLY